MTKRNQLRGLFGGLNAGNPRGREDVAFYHLVLRNQIECLALKPDFSHRNRRPDTGRFARDIDHLRAAVSGDMGEASHWSAADCDHFAARFVIVAKIVLLRFSIDNVQEKLFEFLITRAGSKWFHNIKLEITAETRT